MEFNTVKDSGIHEEFDTGSRRDTQDGKGRPDLIPIEPLRRLAKHYENGAKKYGDRNWEKGQKLSRYYASMMRHMWAFMEGDYSEDHLSAAVWNIFSIIATQERIIAGKLSKELDDIGAIQAYHDYMLEIAARDFDQTKDKIPIYDVTLKRNDTVIAKAPEGYILTHYTENSNSAKPKINAGEIVVTVKSDTSQVTQALQEVSDVLDTIAKKTERVVLPRTLQDIIEKHMAWIRRMEYRQSTPLEQIALITSELGEIVNECRGIQCTERVGEELADVILRVISLADMLNIDIERAIYDKIALNEQKGNKGRSV